MYEELNSHSLDQVFQLLASRLLRNGAPPVQLVVCGGAAMIATGLLSRTTRDVDIIAFLDDAQRLVAPVPYLLKQLLENMGYGNVAETI